MHNPYRPEPEELADLCRQEMGEPATRGDWIEISTTIAWAVSLSLLLYLALAAGCHAVAASGTMPLSCTTLECAAEGGAL